MGVFAHLKVVTLHLIDNTSYHVQRKCYESKFMWEYRAILKVYVAPLIYVLNYIRYCFSTFFTKKKILEMLENNWNGGSITLYSIKALERLTIMILTTILDHC